MVAVEVALLPAVTLAVDTLPVEVLVAALVASPAAMVVANKVDMEVVSKVDTAVVSRSLSSVVTTAVVVVDTKISPLLRGF